MLDPGFQEYATVVGNHLPQRVLSLSYHSMSSVVDSAQHIWCQGPQSAYLRFCSQDSSEDRPIHKFPGDKYTLGHGSQIQGTLAGSDGSALYDSGGVA
mmetsp:Transcript_21890/g.43038  ORF Transcript_21890/g.43038 Transcript_21890/m.43038 type:complete len:98 (-) Transcript_21890:579-872(-)